MKKRLNPTEILLRELPPEGRAYEYSQDSGELTNSLKDLIDQNDYLVTLTIRPTGNVFDVQGEIQTSLNLQCSSCVADFSFPIKEKFHDVLVIQKPLHKGDQNVKTNHSHEWDENQPEGIYLETDLFDVAEFVHEAIGLAEPIRPLCKDSCESLPEATQRDWLTVGSKDAISVSNNPFSVLEKVKLKS